MSVLALIISIAALIVACLAYQRSGGSIEEMKKKVEELYQRSGGGVDEMKKKVEELGITTENLRIKTADILNNLEKKLRHENFRKP